MGNTCLVLNNLMDHSKLLQIAVNSLSYLEPDQIMNHVHWTVEFNDLAV